MKLELLLKQMTAHYAEKKPFVIFSLPDSTEVTLWRQMTEIDDEPETCMQKPGFVFAPFDKTEKKFCIQKEQATCETATVEYRSQTTSLVVTTALPSVKKRHIELVEKTIGFIKSKNADKIVISREKELDLKKTNIGAIFSNILYTYPTAFRYLWYHPQTDVWCGASPELLVKTQCEELSTMSLAGTQKYDPNTKVVWTHKEKKEQQLVTEALMLRLEKLTQVLRPSNTYTFKAGSLLHIRTDIKGVLKRSKVNKREITAALHPTPAVCGTPRETARAFLLENEGYNRMFYTGFLGISELFENVSQFYVNLRCMRIRQDKAFIYVGGGITIDSDPEQEWEETQNKLQTMLQVLRPFL